MKAKRILWLAGLLALAAVPTRAEMPDWLSVSGYLDVGWFDVQGDGTGGDPLAVTINANGEPPWLLDAHSSAMAIHKASLSLGAKPHRRLFAFTRLELLPMRTNSPADRETDTFFNVDLLYLRWQAVSKPRFDLQVFAGKFDAIIGVEYRYFSAPDRVGVTPSIIGRYSIGRPEGVKVRSIFPFAAKRDMNVTLNVGWLTRHQIDEVDERQFGLDLDGASAFAGRLSYHANLRTDGKISLEVGVGNERGTRDAPEGDDLFLDQWQYDLTLRLWSFEVMGEFNWGRWEAAEGADLEVEGWYVQVAPRFWNRFTPYVRFGKRDATQIAELGKGLGSMASPSYYPPPPPPPPGPGPGPKLPSKLSSRTNVDRRTVGVRVDLTRRLIAKVEYVENREIDPTEPAENNVFTTSLIFRFP